MDVWNFTCLLFVFGALLEFALINVKTRKEEATAKEMLQRKSKTKVRNMLVWNTRSNWGEPKQNNKDFLTPRSFKSILKKKAFTYKIKG